MEDEKRKATWTTVETFTEEGSALAVRLQVSDHQRPDYSSQAGRVWEGRFIPHFRRRARAEGGVVGLEDIDLAVLGRLIKRAGETERLLRQEREDQFQAGKRGQQDREDRKVLGNRPKQRNSNNRGDHRGGREGNWGFER